MRLSLEELAVSTFSTEPEPVAKAEPDTTSDTQDPLCYSPWCGPTHWRTCDTQTA